MTLKLSHSAALNVVRDVTVVTNLLNYQYPARPLNDDVPTCQDLISTSTVLHDGELLTAFASVKAAGLM